MHVYCLWVSVAKEVLITTHLVDTSYFFTSNSSITASIILFSIFITILNSAVTGRLGGLWRVRVRGKRPYHHLDYIIHTHIIVEQAVPILQLKETKLVTT